MHPLLLLSFIKATTISLDSVQQLPAVEVVASLKHQSAIFEQPASTSSFLLTDIENKRIESPKDLSLIAPNLYQPDYGSKMTSSMYVRGLGTRMDQPTIGLYIDNMPILNKNSYDFDFFDIRRIDVLRGPQGTLYGRNSVGGVINIFTLSPLSYQGSRFSAGYGNANTFNVHLSTYQRPTETFGFSVSAYHKQSDGFFINTYTGEKTDRYFGNGVRFRMQWQLNNDWLADNITSVNLVKQDGFAYSKYNTETGETLPINHNDPCNYERSTITNGLSFRYSQPKVMFESTTGFQYLNDEMTLDQDFLPESYFTLTQRQREKAITQEFILRSNLANQTWQWLFGLFGFYKHLDMNAPVTFKKNGIDELILENANNGIHTVLPGQDLLLQEEEFPIYSNFVLPNYGLSFYHQSSFHIKKWTFIAGLRFDYEQAAIRYNNSTLIHYTISPAWNYYRPVKTEIAGEDKTSPSFKILPKFSAMYSFNNGNVYASAARGYKAGGYNTQIASDIVQNQMMNDMMDDMGVYLNLNNGIDISSLSYKPEYSWNYEVGSSIRFFDEHFSANAVLFFIDCTDQQLTVFPPGKSTGRKMSNAGRTQSFGTEISLNYTDKKFHFNAAYGYANAKFISYNDGNNDYAGNFIPYAPQNTLALVGEYKIYLNKKYLDMIRFQVDWTGVGKIYWNEDNSLSQPFYGQLGSSIALSKGNAKIQFWAKNITNAKFNTFYFKSMGNSFVQQGKPLQIGTTFSFTL